MLFYTQTELEYDSPMKSFLDQSNQSFWTNYISLHCSVRCKKRKKKINLFSKFTLPWYNHKLKNIWLELYEMDQHKLEIKKEDKSQIKFKKFDVNLYLASFGDMFL